MKRMFAVIAVLAGALLTGACADQRDEPAEAFAPTAEQPAKPVRLQWGQPATVSGTNGSKLKVTPIGVLYDKGSPDIEPENGVFVVIALRAEAVDQPETIAAPITGGGFMWQGADAQKISGTEGNAVITPWVGSVNEFSNVPIQPGEPEVGIETFDVPAKGGRLIYVDPLTAAVTSWELPDRAQGTGLDKVRRTREGG